MTRTTMPLMILRRSATVRLSRALVVLVALTLGATVGSTLLNLYFDVDAKLHREFRNFGANVIVVSRDGGPLPLAQINATLGPKDTVPYAYAIAKDPEGRPVVVVGTYLGPARRMNPGWQVDARISDPEAVLVGKRVAATMGTENLVLTFGGKTQEIHQASILSTGGPEDSRIYMPLHAFTAWTGIPATALEISIPSPAADVNASIQRLQSSFPQLDVRPVRQLLEAETRVLDKTRSILLATSLLIAILVVFCVLATLTSSVLERRRDFALMKALGCSYRMVAGLIVMEACTIAVLGSVIGFVLGALTANIIGRVNFHAPLSVRMEAFPYVLTGSLLVALVGAALPLTRLRQIQPAVMLKGD